MTVRLSLLKAIYSLSPLKSVKKAIKDSLSVEEKIRFSGIKFIDKREIDAALDASHDPGVSGRAGKPEIIVSLTSFPERMDELHYTIHSLLSQTFRPDQVVLWLCRSQFPGLERDLPGAVLALAARGLTIRFCEQDLRSYTKLVPSLRAYPEAVIVTADDDIYYDPGWLERLVKIHQTSPGTVVAHVAKEIALREDGTPMPYGTWHRYSFLRRPRGDSAFIFAAGYGGILYPPGSLHADVVREDLFLGLAPYADDIWFWAMSVLEGTGVRLIGPRFQRRMAYVNPQRELGLSTQLRLASSNIQQQGNDRQLRAVLDHYPVLAERLSRPS